MKKVLMIASVDFHFTSFHIPYIKYFQDRGIEVHIAAKSGERTKDLEALGVIFHHIDFSRSPYSPKLFHAYVDLKNVMAKERFDLVHVHTPVAAFLGRLAAKKTKTKPVLYTAHGFHFYKGASALNWLIYYPMEKIAARWTDGLITINEEDYKIARSFSMKRKDGLFYVHGVGVSKERYAIPHDFDRESQKEKIGFNKENRLLVCVGEFTKNKNQKQLINAMNEVLKNYPNVHLLFIGRGEMEEELKSYVDRLKLSKNIHFLGYRRDVPELLWIADGFALTSRREGLPRAMMEAMAVGLPVIATDIRGNRDLVQDGVNGILVGLEDMKGTAHGIEMIISDEKLRNKMRLESRKIIENYSIDRVLDEMKQIYEKYI